MPFRLGSYPAPSCSPCAFKLRRRGLRAACQRAVRAPCTPKLLSAPRGGVSTFWAPPRIGTPAAMMLGQRKLQGRPPGAANSSLAGVAEAEVEVSASGATRCVASPVCTALPFRGGSYPAPGCSPCAFRLRRRSRRATCQRAGRGAFHTQAPPSSAAGVSTLGGAVWQLRASRSKTALTSSISTLTMVCLMVSNVCGGS